MAPESDRTLVERVIRDGDELAFRALYDLYTPRLLRGVLHFLGGSDMATAEDIVQETWIRAAKGFASFEWRSRLDAWLTGISFNVARESLRRDHHEVLLDPEDDPPQSHDDPHGRIDLDGALRRLAEGRRAVLILHDLDGYTHAEVAALLGIAVGTSKSQLHDARVELERHLTEGTDHDEPAKR